VTKEEDKLIQAEGSVAVSTLYFSQCKDLRIGVVLENLGALHGQKVLKS